MSLERDAPGSRRQRGAAARALLRLWSLVGATAVATIVVLAILGPPEHGKPPEPAPAKPLAAAAPKPEPAPPAVAPPAVAPPAVAPAAVAPATAREPAAATPAEPAKSQQAQAESPQAEPPQPEAGKSPRAEAAPAQSEAAKSEAAKSEAAKPEAAKSAASAGAPRAAEEAAVVPIAAPDPALLEPADFAASALLPRIGANGRLPMRVYAAHVTNPVNAPRIAILLAGIGLSETDSADAIEHLPAAVSLAVSPYASHAEPLLATARAHGHEFLISIPMEPQGYPLNDEGPEALLTSAPPALNMRRLEWTLSRIAGYAGATGALDGMRGERFAASHVMLGQVEDVLAHRGLFYIDPRAGRPLRRVAGRGVDIIIDEPGVRPEIEAKLAALERLAHDHGSALGLAGLPRPVTVERLAAWAATLAARGFALVPVSALVTAAPAERN